MLLQQLMAQLSGQRSPGPTVTVSSAPATPYPLNGNAMMPMMSSFCSIPQKRAPVSNLRYSAGKVHKAREGDVTTNRKKVDLSISGQEAATVLRQMADGGEELDSSDEDFVEEEDEDMDEDEDE